MKRLSVGNGQNGSIRGVFNSSSRIHDEIAICNLTDKLTVYIVTKVPKTMTRGHGIEDGHHVVNKTSKFGYEFTLLINKEVHVFLSFNKPLYSKLKRERYYDLRIEMTNIRGGDYTPIVKATAHSIDEDEFNISQIGSIQSRVMEYLKL